MRSLILPPSPRCEAVADENDPPMKCGRCKVVRPASQLDAVLLDPDGNEASDIAYCLLCFPLVATIPGDRWRALF